MSKIAGLGLTFKEKMSGYLMKGAPDFDSGWVEGKKRDLPAKLDSKITIDDMEKFLNISEHSSG